jgi:hypothetical protein
VKSIGWRGPAGLLLESGDDGDAAMKKLLTRAKVEGKYLDNMMKVFEDNSIDVVVLPRLTQEMLKMYDIKVGVQLKLMMAIKK